MKKIIAILALGAIFNGFAQVDRSKAPAAGPAPEIQIGKPDVFELDNGLKVIVVENHKLPRVSVRLFADYGVIQEGETAGMLEMFGGAWESGTETRSKAQIAEELDYIAASVSFGSNGFYASSLTKHQDKMMEIVSDIFYNPSFPEEELEKLRTRSISGIASEKSNPDAMAASLRSAVLYGKEHPYGEAVTEETVGAVSREDFVNHYDTYLKPNVSYLVIVGDINSANAKAMAEKYFGKWEKGEVTKEEFDTKPGPDANKVVFVKKPGAEQSVISVSFPVELTPGHQDELTVKMMNAILGGGVFSGRLMQNLRETHAYTYGCRSSISSDELIGSFSTSGSFRNDVTDSAITQILFEIKRMTTEMPTMEELMLVKNSMTGSFARSLESPQTIANFALNTIRYNLPEDYYSGYLKRLNAVTLNDIKTAAEKYLKPDNAYIVVCGNESVISKLDKFDLVDNQVSVMDMYGNEQEELKPAPEGLTAYDLFETHYMKLTKTDDLAAAKQKISKLKSYKSVYKGELQGFQVSMSEFYTSKGQSMTKFEAGGMTLMKSVINGSEGYVMVQGNKEAMEGEALEKAKEQTGFWQHLNARTQEKPFEIKGMGKYKGENAYYVTLKTENSEMEYIFSEATGLLLKEEGTVSQGEVKMEVGAEYLNYADKGDYLVTEKISRKMGPMSIELSLDSFETGLKFDKNTFN